MTKRIVLGVQLLVTATLLTLLFRDFDWGALGETMRRLPAWFFAVSFGAVVAGQVLYAYRWRLILRALDIDISFKVAFEQYVIGMFFNNFLPSTMGGDWVKMYYLGRDQGYIRVGASLLVDRILGIFWVALLAAVLLWVIPAHAPVLVVLRSILTAVAAALVLLLASAAVLPGAAWSARLGRRVPRLARVAGSVSALLGHIRHAMRHPFILAGSGLVVVTYFVILGGVYHLFLGLAEGASPGLVTTTTVASAIATLSNAPVSLNGLGLREQLHLAMLSVFGVSRESAAGISLLLFGYVAAMSVVGAIAWVRGPKTKIRRAPALATSPAQIK